MATYSLDLIPIPARQKRITVDLQEYDAQGGAAIEKIIKKAPGMSVVFADLEYEFCLHHPDSANIKDVRVYINDMDEICTFTTETAGESEINSIKIRFPEQTTHRRKIFMDCYGYVELKLFLALQDGTEQQLRSAYIPVLVQRGARNEAVQAMVQYIYTREKSLFLHGASQRLDGTQYKEDEPQNLETQILLAEQIAAVYEDSYGYFKANSRFHIEKVATVSSLEKLQYPTSATFRYIVSHPEQLRPVASNQGIRIGNRSYQPEKTLSVQNVHSYDIYENQIILSFLHRMIDELYELQEKCEQYLQEIPENEDYNEEYVYSSFFIFSAPKKTLKYTQKQLAQLSEKYSKLYGLYQDALQIAAKPMYEEPEPTNIFLAVPQYAKIFVQIHRWFHLGRYDFTKEEDLLSLVKISALYERYLLTKLITYLQDRKYTLQQPRHYRYPVLENGYYQNTECNNTFSFCDGKTDITLYYQPVIFDADRVHVNEIGLYRNNSLTIFREKNERPQGGCYYVPDFLVKITQDEQVRYLLIDAKYSDAGSIKRYYAEDLVFKYLFSISALDEKDTIAGLCILYGKCEGDTQASSLYDKCAPRKQISPLAEMIPLMEDAAKEEHYDKLDELFRKVFQSNGKG